jgi:hypothetical protein
LSGGFGEHLGLWVHADCCGDVLCERGGQLAGAAAHVEKSPAAIEVEPGDEIGKERLRIAGGGIAPSTRKFRCTGRSWICRMNRTR